MSQVLLANSGIEREQSKNSISSMMGDKAVEKNCHYQLIADGDDLNEISVLKSDSVSIDSTHTEHGKKDKKKMNVYICEEFTDEDSIVETTALKGHQELARPENYFTMSGTIQRGKKKGEKVEVVLNMSREELETLEINVVKGKRKFECGRGPRFGIHIFLWSLICLPVSFIVSAIYSFCIGTITWYSIFTLFSESESLTWKILIPPILIILYPFMIILVSVGLGLYAGIKQLSCYWNTWLEEFVDYEKGFYGWLCNALDIPECSPYEIVILSGLDKE